MFKSEEELIKFKLIVIIFFFSDPFLANCGLEPKVEKTETCPAQQNSSNLPQEDCSCGISAILQARAKPHHSTLPRMF